MRRINPKTGELFLPHIYEDGRYRVADPTLGKAMHHAKNQVAVAAASELVKYVERGFSVRMRGVDSGQVNLVRPDQIQMPDETASPTPLIQQSPYPDSLLEAPAPSRNVEKNTPGLLPQHGRISCSRCFGGENVVWGQSTCEPESGWQIVNNPMAWGSRTPGVLVLGFSKGGTQNADILSRSHNEVAFRGGRKNLSIILETLGLLSPHYSIDELIAAQQGDFAFGSLVRCSAMKRDGDQWLMSGKDIMSSCIRGREMGIVIRNCVSQFLGDLPSSVRLVVMLGNDTRYVEGCFAAVRNVRPSLTKINAVAYGDDRVVFVHAVHFKAQGAIVPNWTNGVPGAASRSETDQPLKRELAKAAVSSAMYRKVIWPSEGMKLYHGTPTVNRDSVKKYGLVLGPDEGERERSLTGGIFFSSKRPKPQGQIDIWEVNLEGLTLQIDDTDQPSDPEDTWWVFYGKVVDPCRLRLLEDQ